MARLSLCMIVRNESGNLAKCLDSVDDLADELVIVDTGSTDSTLEIARARADQLIEAPWGEDFSAARNAGLDAATGDWVLVLDADEKLRREAISAVKAAVESADVDAYEVGIENHLTDGNEIVHQVRLFRRNGQNRYSGRVLEQVSAVSPARLGGVLIDHRGFVGLLLAKKRTRNAKILRLALVDNPDDNVLNFQLYKETGDPEPLTDAADRIVRLPEEAQLGTPMAAEIMAAAAMYWADRGEAGRAMKLCEALDQFPRQARHYLAYGLALAHFGHLEHAEEALKVGLDEDLGTPAQRLKCALALGQIQLAQDKSGQALETLRETQGTFSRHPVALHNLLRALLHTGKCDEAIQRGMRWFEAHQDDKTALLLCAEAAERLGHAGQARQWRSIAAKAPG